MPSAEVEALIEDDDVAAVTLTGSVAAGPQRRRRGRRGAEEERARARRLRRLPRARGRRHRRGREGLRAARMVNGGQSCIAGKRFIVVARSRERSRTRSSRRCARYEMGDPREEATRLGPMQSVEARDEIHAPGDAKASRRARGCCSAARSPTGPAPGIRRPCSTDVRPASRRTTRRFRPGRGGHRRATTKRTRSRSPTPASSASARAC